MSLDQTIPDQGIGVGFTLHRGRGATRLEMECKHQHALLYVTEGADQNWVCSLQHRPAHSLAGFFQELVALDDSRVTALMQRWGLYYRVLPLTDEGEGTPLPASGGS